MAKTRRRKRVFEQEREKNLTPLIDCVFLLLIFFMVTTVFKQPYRLQVELPQARHARAAEEKKLVASITADGRMEINREPVDQGDLDQVLLRAKQSTGSLTLILRTDKEAKHKWVLLILAAAKRVGVDTILLATEDKDA
ncbi:MAG TPA: biopolymer transporter ExbD [Planctomycetes bacterium]|nr:biopolymer transporter ExbD [Planctomycetota bacterium]